MTTGNDKLEVRFVGNKINPLAVKPHEIAALLIGFEKALLSEIKERHPQFDTGQLLFSFNQIKNESLGLEFLPISIKEIVVGAFTAISTGFQTGDFSNISNNTIKELKTFTRFSKEYNCSGELSINGDVLSSFSPSTDIPFNRNPIIKGDIKIFGRVIDAGGDNPNVHLKINDEKVLIFWTTEVNVKKLAHRLYEKVALVGNAKWDAVTYEITEFKLLDILDFNAGNTFGAIQELKNITSGYWENYNSNDDINKQLLRD